MLRVIFQISCMKLKISWGRFILILTINSIALRCTQCNTLLVDKVAARVGVKRLGCCQAHIPLRIALLYSVNNATTFPSIYIIYGDKNSCFVNKINVVFCWWYKDKIHCMHCNTLHAIQILLLIIEHLKSRSYTT